MCAVHRVLGHQVEVSDLEIVIQVWVNDDVTIAPTKLHSMNDLGGTEILLGSGEILYCNAWLGIEQGRVIWRQNRVIESWTEEPTSHEIIYSLNACLMWLADNGLMVKE